MANTFIPVRINYSGSTPTGFAEYQTGETAVLPGSLQFTGSGRRIQADFSSADPLAFQEITANTRTLVYAMPSGTATESGYVVRNASSLTATSIGIFRVNTTSVSLESNVAGAATQLPMTFWTSGSERVRVSTGGVVSIGTTSVNPVTDQVTGFAFNPTFASFNATSGTPLAIGKSTTTSGFLINFYYNGVSAGSITTNGTTTAYNTSSDHRLKENVAPADAATAWERLTRYEIVKFNFLSTPDEVVEFGGIAHKLAEVNPDMVTGEKDAVEGLGSLYATRPVGDLYTKDGQLVAVGVQEPQDHDGWWNFTGVAEFLVSENEPAPVAALPGTRWEQTGERMIVQGVDWSKAVPEMILNMQTMKAKIEALENELAALRGA